MRGILEMFTCAAWSPRSTEEIDLPHNPIPKCSRVWLPECDYLERSRTWDETMGQMEATMEPPRMRNALRHELAKEAANFPPRLHERVFICKGLNIDALRDVTPNPGLKIMMKENMPDNMVNPINDYLYKFSNFDRGTDIQIFIDY
ncbi:hypothetical protein TESG_00429 [Trichophyton tonsurans CBS 112818]|uniref:Uncharacterized protein n=1 Tax=Trichophyton tonsurans (strain CBS 112818) TaxID=647933 RepID=F2RNG1_TRIT1|nr:hypothetical protein TESG_00429 [Trichophyton tonsurans CBS 112818]